MTASRHRWLAVAPDIASCYQGRCALCGLERTRRSGSHATTYFLAVDGCGLVRIVNKGRVPTCPPETKEDAP